MVGKPKVSLAAIDRMNMECDKSYSDDLLQQSAGSVEKGMSECR